MNKKDELDVLANLLIDMKSDHDELVESFLALTEVLEDLKKGFDLVLAQLKALNDTSHP